MRITSVSLQEIERLENLYSYDILDSASENEFSDLVELAASIYGCPHAAITFIDKNRMWLKASIGIGMTETPRNISFCTHTILDDQTLVVADTLQDERFVTNPLVTSDPSIRFYAGAPIVSTEGHNLGAVCILDNKPKNLTGLQTKSLEAIARQVTKLLELRLKNKLLQQWATKGINGQKELLQQTLLQHHEKALEFSTELHENIAQGLAATKFYLEMAEAEPTQFLIKKSRENISKLIDDTRRLSRKLYPTTLRQSSFADLVQQLAQDFKETAGIEILLTIKGADSLQTELPFLLYRIAEEQLINIKKYAAASEVAISLSVNGVICLLIKDNGAGFAEDDFSTGYGINKMVSLAEYYGGHIDISSQPGNGCQLQVTIPVFKDKRPVALQPAFIDN